MISPRPLSFGIRVALGVGAGDVIGMVLGNGLKLAGIGLAIGIAGALALTRMMTTLLYDVKPTDPVVFIIVAIALTVAALLASLIRRYAQYGSVRAEGLMPGSAEYIRLGHRCPLALECRRPNHH